jgi:hypothetical protein
MRWAVLMTSIWGKRCAYRVGWGNIMEKDQFEDLGVDGRIVLKWIFKIWDGAHGLD